MEKRQSTEGIGVLGELLGDMKQLVQAIGNSAIQAPRVVADKAVELAAKPVKVQGLGG